MTRSLVTARAALHDGRLCPPPIKDERYHAYAIACTPDLVAQAVLSVTASGTPGQAAATQLRVYGEAAADAAPAAVAPRLLHIESEFGPCLSLA